MRSLLGIVGMVGGAVIGGTIGLGIMRAVIGGQLEETGGGLLILLTAVLVVLIVGGGWLGRRIVLWQPPLDRR